jgi:hypothetical protein
VASRVVVARLWPAPDDPPRSELNVYKFQQWVRQSGAHPLFGLLKPTGFELVGAGLPCRDCRLAAVQGQGKASVRG